MFSINHQKKSAFFTVLFFCLFLFFTISRSFAERVTVAVGRFEAAGQLGSGGVGEGMAAMLTEALMRAGYPVVERAGLNELIRERKLQGIDQSAGGLKGARVLVKGTVTKFEPNAGGSSSNVAINPFALLPMRRRRRRRIFWWGTGIGIGSKNEYAEVGITIRLIDVATGQVISTHNSEARASNEGTNFTIYQRGLRFGSSSFKKTPLADASRKAIEDAVSHIGVTTAYLPPIQTAQVPTRTAPPPPQPPPAQTPQVEKKVTTVVTATKSSDSHKPWSGLVMDVIKGKVYINVGVEADLKAGDILVAFKKIKELTDPETGKLVDVIEEKVGKVRVETVKKKYSIAVSIEGNLPERGDVVRQEQSWM